MDYLLMAAGAACVSCLCIGWIIGWNRGWGAAFKVVKHSERGHR